MSVFKSWGLMRMLRLLFGAFAIVQAVIVSDLVLGLMGLAVGGMAFFNVGCCGSGGCRTDNRSDSSHAGKVTYEEITSGS